MKKFKVFIASVLTYFMAMSILPVNLLETVAKAAENDHTTLVKSDYYLRGNAQYKGKALIGYIKPGFVSNDMYLSLVEGGKETPLKEMKDSLLSRIISNNKGKAVIEYYDIDGANFYEEFNFETLEFKSITGNEFQEFLADSNIYYSYGNYTSYIYGNMEENGVKIEGVLQKINESNSKYNFTISDKKYTSDDNGVEYSNDNGYLNITMYEKGAYNKEFKVKIDLYDFKIKEYNKLTDTYKYYSGVVTDKDVLIEECSEEEFERIHMEMYYQGQESFFLYHYVSDDGKKKIIEIKDNKIIANQTIDLPLWNSTKIGNDLYAYNEITKKLEIYSLENTQYKLSKEIDSLGSRLTHLKRSELPSILERANGKVYFSQIVDGNIIRKADVTSGLSKFYDINIQESDGATNILYIEGDNDGNYFISNPDNFMVVQKKTGEEPNKPEEPGKPENPGDNDNNIVIKPSEDKVVAEVPKINPNEENEIKVNTEDSAKKVDVTIKDVESLKNGTGALNITVNNGVKLNLPLSTIDKSLLEGAKDVTISLDVIENSDIVKDIKSVNKVFDFNLIVNNEDGNTFIHNFKDGQAEITLSLTDKELEGLNKDNIVVYYYNETEKKFEAMETKVAGNKVTFTTSHFSKYIIAEKLDDSLLVDKDENTTKPEENTNSSNTNNTEAGKGILPETGSVVSSSVILVLALVAVVIGGSLLIRRKKYA